ncbi:MAG: hypothetical protein ABL308_01920 [Oceanicaulis sp.]
MPITLEDALESENTWSDGYYNAVRFFYWWPKVLAKIPISQLKKQQSKFVYSSDLVNFFREKIDDSPGLERRTFAKLDRQEEPFNHQLELFLRLAPAQAINALLAHCGVNEFDERPSVLTRSVEQVWPGTQPDILLLSKSAAVAIEVKPPHGRSFEGQLAKYALLFENLRKARPTVERTDLIFLANGGFEDNLPRKTPTLAAFRDSEKAWARTRSRHAFKVLDDDELLMICYRIDATEPRFLSFSDFLRTQDQALGPSETERLLFDGIRKEIERRGYV